MKALQRTIVVVAIFSLISLGLIPVTMAQSQRPYRYNDNYVRQVLQRLETRTIASATCCLTLSIAADLMELIGKTT